MEIGIVLSKFGLWPISNFPYTNWWLFDGIVYLEYSQNSITIHRNFMLHLQKCLNLKTQWTLQCHTNELIFEFLHDLHNGQVNDETSYCKNVNFSYGWRFVGWFYYNFFGYHNICCVEYMFGTKTMQNSWLKLDMNLSLIH